MYNISSPIYLTKYGSIGAKERSLSSIEITVMPDLAIGLRIAKESLVALLGALKTGLRDLRIVRIIDARSSSAWSWMFIYSNGNKIGKHNKVKATHLVPWVWQSLPLIENGVPLRCPYCNHNPGHWTCARRDAAED